jgi:hypothetical protein
LTWALLVASACTTASVPPEPVAEQQQDLKLGVRNVSESRACLRRST